MSDLTWKQFIELLPYYIAGAKNAECKGCRRIHPTYKFSPKQLYFMQVPMYLLYCENCGTRIHIPTEREMNCDHNGKIRFIKHYKVQESYIVEGNKIIEKDGNYDYFTKNSDKLDAECLKCGILFVGYNNFPEIIKDALEVL